MKKINIILQARVGSSRVPGKVLKKLNDKVVIQHMIDRLNRCKKINNIIIATTTNVEATQPCKLGTC